MEQFPGAPVNRQEIKNALLALAANAIFPVPVNGFNTWAQPPSRRLRLWNAVDPSLQPACFLVQHRETYRTAGVGRLTRRYLDMGFWCYAPSGDPASSSVIGDDYIDLMESALEQALAPDDPQRGELTLGGLLTPNNGWVRVDKAEGQYVRDPGDIDGQALLILPVRILLP